MIWSSVSCRCLWAVLVIFLHFIPYHNSLQKEPSGVGVLEAALLLAAVLQLQGIPRRPVMNPPRPTSGQDGLFHFTAMPSSFAPSIPLHRKSSTPSKSVLLSFTHSYGLGLALAPGDLLDLQVFDR